MSIRATHSYADRGDLAGDLAWMIANQLMSAVEENGEGRIAVSGGGTPKLLFSMLSAIDLPWDAITICLVDDRCVAPDHEHSNVALVNEYLRQGDASEARLVSLFDPELGAQDSAAAATRALMPADVLILGMGADAHTASLFPGSPQLSDGLYGDAPAVICAEPTMAPLVPRLTLNKAAIDSAGLRILHIEGGGKRDVFERAKQPNVDPLMMPISTFLNDPHTDIEVYWAP